MIGKDQSPNIGKVTQFHPGKSGNPSGRPKGRKSLSTIIRELENEEFDWSKLPIRGKKLRAYCESTGSPWRVIVMYAVVEAIDGNHKAREWLRKSCYGNGTELEPIPRETVEPIVMSHIKPRPRQAQIYE